MKFKYVIIYKILLLFAISILFSANRPTPDLRGFTRNYKDIRKEILMNTVQLECFLAVAEYLNFSRAAEFLKITQPAVSHQITSLEDELGIRLFVRTSKNVNLTEAGLMFMEDASSILKIASGAKVIFCPGPWDAITSRSWTFCLLSYTGWRDSFPLFILL